jgi:hypothetical protein
MAHVAKNVSFDSDVVKKAMAEAEHKKALERIARRDQANLFIYHMSYDVSEIVHAERAPQQSGVVYAPSSVYVDGQEVVRIPEHRFISLALTPGKHAITTDKSGIELDLISGEDYYLCISGGSKKQLRLVSSDEGEEQIYPMYPVSEALREP